MLASGDDIQRNYPLVQQQKAVWLGSDYITDLFVKNYCPATLAQGLNSDFNLLVRSDVEAPEKIMGLPYSASLNAERKKRYLKMTTSLLELGIVRQTIKLTEFTASPFTGSPALMECLSNKIITHDHELQSVGLSHYRQLFAVSFYLLAAFTIALVIEVMHHRRVVISETAHLNGEIVRNKSRCITHETRQRVTTAPAVRSIDGRRDVRFSRIACRRRSASHRIRVTGGLVEENSYSHSVNT
jgi:hypothetical protein